MATTAALASDFLPGHKLTWRHNPGLLRLAHDIWSNEVEWLIVASERELVSVSHFEARSEISCLRIEGSTAD